MPLIFAHHLEPEHVAVMIVLFLVGGLIGWAMTSFLINRINSKARPSA
jgi:hypothetical protein